jgi:hypothetical protein
MHKAKPSILHCGRSMDLFLGPRKPRGVPFHASFFPIRFMVKLDKLSKLYKKYKSSTTQFLCVLKEHLGNNNNKMIFVEQHIKIVYATNADQLRIHWPMQITQHHYLSTKYN